MISIKTILKLLLMCTLVIIFPATKAEGKGNELSIEVKQDKVLFHSVSLAPGRSTSEILTIQNRGDFDFNYNSSSKLKKGEKLFNELLLKVQDSKGELLFDGRLTDFKELGNRKLKSNYEEDLKIFVSLPSHIGNEFQGESCEFELTFYAKQNSRDPNQDDESQDPVSPGDDNGSPQSPIGDETLTNNPSKAQVLPQTATNVFNNLFAGVLILLLGAGILLFNKNNLILKRNFKNRIIK
ncbi:LPXTG cell wall anchor domain-containing protein [Cytobacillus firmus]|uniref:LPXTG cell wall anchor domain-containing protein n=1 Tax=Cytobacillus firmus TaxID=1399 RepID=UPI0024C1F2FB|nr:LPXTG cell wall anchor domain-containing protein [Cytobacillus firmus]WHY35141.1 LPXTG cell wall anchor domain-containing protein [Cytobacillus firmus]